MKNMRYYSINIKENKIWKNYQYYLQGYAYKAKGKVTKQQVRELKKEHSGKDEGNIIIWEAEEAK